MTGSDLARALDAADPIAPARDRFRIPDGLVYLDGNSLGAMPSDAPAGMADLVERQWGRDLISSWNRHDWVGLPLRLGARIAPLVGAAPDEVVVADTTSTNLFKLVAAACAARPGRGRILTERGDFPTDAYMAHGVATMLGDRVVDAVAPDALPEAIGPDVALVLLSHVHYRTGARHDMARLTALAHAGGALVLWDLSHSTGAVPVALDACDADLAVGCGYKYLNGGPGAPAFLFVARRLQPALVSPLSGWFGHAAPFAFDGDYRPADGIARFQCGTPSVLALAALARGLATFDGIDPGAIHAKSASLTGFFLDRMDETAGLHGFALASPRDPARRGSHLSFAHPHAWPVCRALAARGIVGDFRPPDLLRLGFAPLYNTHLDAWRAADAIVDLMRTGAWDRPAFHAAAQVT